MRSAIAWRFPLVCENKQGNKAALKLVVFMFPL